MRNLIDSRQANTRLPSWVIGAQAEIYRRESKENTSTKNVDDSTAEQRKCSADIFHWINTYVKTYDPRCKPSLVEFKLYPRQKEFIQWVQEREKNQEEGVADKSRDVGFTWLCCAYALHIWLYRPYSSVGFGSRKLELVDTIGDPKSIFEKLRIILRNLPAWMLPKGFDISKHAGSCKIVNPETNSVISGEGGDQIGRGDRKSIYFVDEAAFLERPLLVEAALSQTTPCKIWVSTPNGQRGAFYRKRFSGKIPVFTFHWRDDPRKDEAWYQKQKDTLDSIVLAQEVDIDYSASLEGVVIPAKWVQAAVRLKEVAREKGIALPANGPIIAGFDVADEGKNKCVFIVKQGIGIVGIESWGHANTTQSAYRSKEYGERYKINYLNYDCIGVGAGIKGTYASLDKPPSFTVNPINTGDSPTDTKWPDDKTSKDRFRNLRAELWWLARVRFEKTFEYVEKGIEHPLDELVSIPNQAELAAQLSQPTYHFTETGKIQIESKETMQKRGINSPDFADALVLAVAGEGLFTKSGWSRFA